MNRIWIVGAQGRVGKSLSRLLDTIENELFCTDLEEVDITDMESVNTYTRMYRPDIIINCASVPSQKECEENADWAYQVNALGARNLAVQANKTGAKFVQMSTDDVFYGPNVGHYNEFDMPNPSSLYGKSKYAGERMALRLCAKTFVVRSSWVYGIGDDYVDAVCKALEAGEKVEANVNEKAIPTSAERIAQVIEQLIKTEQYGIYHAVPKGECSRYDFAVDIAKAKGYDSSLVIPVEGEDNNTLLDGMMLRINGITELGDWKDDLENFIKITGGVK